MRQSDLPDRRPDLEQVEGAEIAGHVSSGAARGDAPFAPSIGMDYIGLLPFLHPRNG